MTVPAGGRSKTYAIAAGVTAYPVPFPVIAASDLLVYAGTGAAFDPTDPGVPLTEGVHYTLTGDASTSNAAIVPGAAFPVAGYVTFYRVTSLAQTAAYTPNDGFPAKSHEAQLDRLSLVDQEQAENLDTLGAVALRLPIGETVVPLPPAAERRGKALLFDAATGEPVVQNPPPGASAYQAWLDQGNVGSEADFLASLKGDPGDAAVIADSLVSPQPDVAASTGVVARTAATKPDRFPAAPSSNVKTDYDAYYLGWRQRYYDETNQRLFPLRGLGPANAGTPDLTLPDANGNKASPWMWAMEMRTLVDRYDLTLTATSKARIAGAWAYFKTQYSSAQILSRVYGTNQIIGLSDDPVWFANALIDIHRITADATALTYLLEYPPLICEMFRDTRASNPITDYGVSSPGGIPFKRNQLGYLYAQDHSLGDISSAAELSLIAVYLYIAALPTSATVTAAYKAACLQAAKDTWQMGVTLFKFAGSATAKAGIYVQEVNLAPGNAPGSQRATDIHPDTTIGLTAFGEQGTIAMLWASDALSTLTGEAKYLAEIGSIATAYPDPLGFGRTWKGLPCLTGARDPWGNGFWHLRATRALVARYPDATAFTLFKVSVLGAAKIIAAQSTLDGIISPSWGPPDTKSGAYPGAYTWEQNCAAGYGGSGGGGQGRGGQATTASNSLNVIAAGSLLGSVEATLGAGMASGGIELMNGQLAAAIVQTPADRTRPMRETGGHRALWNPAGYYEEYVGEQQIRALSADGEAVYKAFTSYGPSYLKGRVSSDDYLVAFNAAYSGRLFIGPTGGRAGINLGFDGYAVSSDGNNIDFVVGGTAWARIQPGTMYNNGVFVNGGDIIPSNDNAYSLGGNTNRLKNLYCTNTTIQTSDEREKDWLAGMTDAEYAVGLRVLREIGTFRWKSDGDRIHWGVRAQRVWQLCIDGGLIPNGSATDSPYSFLTYQSWSARPAVPAVVAVAEVSHVEQWSSPDGSTMPIRVVDVPGVAGVPERPAVPAGDRYGVRGEELLMWLHAVNDRRLSALEAAHAQ